MAVMNKFKFVVILLFIGFNSIDAQNKKYSFLGNESLVAIGFSYERIQDANYQGERNDNKGIVTDYYTLRNRMRMDLLFELSKRLKTESSLGASFYHSDLYISATTNPDRQKACVNATNLVVSQKIMYDLLYLPGLELRNGIFLSATDFLSFAVSPYIELEYEQFLSKRKRNSGHADLFSNEANKDVANKIPAISAVTKTPIGILSAIAGLSTETRLSDVLGISFDIGYHRSLLGCSRINLKYRHNDNEVHSLQFKSGKDGFMMQGRLRYYF